MEEENELIAEITDETLDIGRTRSQKQPRMTARAIVCDAEGRLAVMHVEKFGLYTLPGGGIEPGETPEQAVLREAAEETGWQCKICGKLGQIVENRGALDYTQISHWFVLERMALAASEQMTQAEIDEGTHCEWHPMEDAVRLIGEAKHDTVQRKYFQARDGAALAAYRAWMEAKQ